MGPESLNAAMFDPSATKYQDHWEAPPLATLELSGESSENHNTFSTWMSSDSSLSSGINSSATSSMLDQVEPNLPQIVLGELLVIYTQCKSVC